MILETGYLKLTESNLRIETVGYKPVVWLTDSDNPSDHSLEFSAVDKTEVKVTVKWNKFFKRWMIWSKKNKITLDLPKRLKRE